jgi:hypothetical protein
VSQRQEAVAPTPPPAPPAAVQQRRATPPPPPVRRREKPAQGRADKADKPDPGPATEALPGPSVRQAARKSSDHLLLAGGLLLLVLALSEALILTLSVRSLRLSA